jgi:dienelactone hydrolase
LTRAVLASALDVHLPVATPDLAVLDASDEDGYVRQRVELRSATGALVPAFLLLPAAASAARVPGIVIHHQHAGQRHLGKSEVCGLAGDPWQAFGPALARRGMAVLAPDSVCFEDRRPHRSGLEADEDGDWLHHFNEMAHRLVRGELLVSEILADALSATATLAAHPAVDSMRVGVMGHSYGGNTTLLQTPLDERVAFACVSGAACSYRRKLADGTGLEFALVIPGFTKLGDIEDLLRLCAPRPMLIASADDDRYSADAAELVRIARPAWTESSRALEHLHLGSGHALTQERFAYQVEWVLRVARG